MMYTLHGYIGRKSVPLVYALMMTKEELDYDRLFDQVEQRCVQDNIQLVPQGFLICEKLRDDDITFIRFYHRLRSVSQKCSEK